jgi:hypothetical protein
LCVFADTCLLIASEISDHCLERFAKEDLLQIILGFINTTTPVELCKYSGIFLQSFGFFLSFFFLFFFSFYSSMFLRLIPPQYIALLLSVVTEDYEPIVNQFQPYHVQAMREFVVNEIVPFHIRVLVVGTLHFNYIFLFLPDSSFLRSVA